MKSDKDLLLELRQRDAEYGENIPSHWTSAVDRRFLLRLLDYCYDENEVDSPDDVWVPKK